VVFFLRDFSPRELFKIEPRPVEGNCLPQFSTASHLAVIKSRLIVPFKLLNSGLPCNRRGWAAVTYKTSFVEMGVLMSETVHCDICGKIFNTRFLQSHRRGAHPHAKNPPDPRNDPRNSPARTEKETVAQILSLFDQLSPDARRRVLNTLASPNPKPR
jgi:hypothetical protein